MLFCRLFCWGNRLCRICKCCFKERVWGPSALQCYNSCMWCCLYIVSIRQWFLNMADRRWLCRHTLFRFCMCCNLLHQSIIHNRFDNLDKCYFFDRSKMQSHKYWTFWQYSFGRWSKSCYHLRTVLDFYLFHSGKLFYQLIEELNFWGWI